MRQRLGIAAALLGDPRVLLFDEPINGLDLDGVRWIRGLLRRLADEGRTVLVSSHLMSEMEQIADRLVVIGRGRLIADATTEEILRGLGQLQVRVRTSQADGSLARLREHGPHRASASTRTSCRSRTAPPRTWASSPTPAHPAAPPLRGAQQSLEDAYLELTGGSVEFHGREAQPAGRRRRQRRDGTVDPGRAGPADDVPAAACSPAPAPPSGRGCGPSGRRGGSWPRPPW